MGCCMSLLPSALCSLLSLLVCKNYIPCGAGSPPELFLCLSAPPAQHMCLLLALPGCSEERLQGCGRFGDQ